MPEKNRDFIDSSLTIGPALGLSTEEQLLIEAARYSDWGRRYSLASVRLTADSGVTTPCPRDLAPLLCQVRDVFAAKLLKDGQKPDSFLLTKLPTDSGYRGSTWHRPMREEGEGLRRAWVAFGNRAYLFGVNGQIPSCRDEGYTEVQREDQAGQRNNAQRRLALTTVPPGQMVYLNPSSLLSYNYPIGLDQEPYLVVSASLLRG